MADAADHALLELTATIVSAHVARTTVASNELPGFIQVVYQALRQASESQAPLGVSGKRRPEPAVPIKQSVFPDYVVCLEDGKKLKMLRRHLSVSYGMTVHEYRARWGLPASYPVVAPNYAAKRSEMARKIGLGCKTRVPGVQPEVQRIAEGVSGKRASRKRKVA